MGVSSSPNFNTPDLTIFLLLDRNAYAILHVKIITLTG